MREAYCTHLYTQHLKFMDEVNEDELFQVWDGSRTGFDKSIARSSIRALKFFQQAGWFTTICPNCLQIANKHLC